MRSAQSAFVFNMALRLAAVACLGSLAIGLFFNVEPLTALMRSVVAFLVFLLLGWAVAATWDVAVPEAAEDEATAGGEIPAAVTGTAAQAASTSAPDEVMAGA